MIHIAEVSLLNWLIFKGLQTVRLGPKAYGITARRPGRERSSNFAGKSAFVEAIRFALHGEHRKRTEDEWLTHGETAGSVQIVLSNGAVVGRERVRGEATRLIVSSGGRQLKGDEAQAEVDRIVGLSREDYVTTRHFEQKQIARLVTAKPAERTALVSGWLGLGKVEEAERLALAAVSAALDDAKDAAAKEAGLRAVVADALVLDDEYELESLDDLRKLLEEQEAKVEQAAHTTRQAEAAWRRSEDKEQAGRDLEEHSRLAMRRELLKEDVAESKPDLENLRARIGEADKKIGALQGEANTIGKAARGEFDGACPASPGFKCPAKKDINDRSHAAVVQLAQIKTKAEAWERDQRLDRKLLLDDEQKLRDIQRAEGELAEVERRLSALAPSAEAARRNGPGGGASEAHEAMSAAKAAEASAREAATRTRVKLERAEKAELELKHLAGRATINQDRLDLARAALAVVGKQGLQRRLAEGTLAQVEGRANLFLADAGIDLSVVVRWSKEIAGLAGACDQCGAAYPASLKVKECARCGAKRGPKTQSKLELELGDQSGGAEDLCGVAVQLAAGDWLCGRRGSEWGALVLDEPFGALDEDNRAALSGALARMLQGGRVVQSFVIAHHAGVLDALPGRIQVVRDGKWSRVEVVA